VTTTRELSVYCAVTPNGQPIRATIGITPDDAWRKLRAALSEPDTLRDKGWRIGLLRCVLVELLDHAA